MTPVAPAIPVSAGVVAYNDAGSLEASVTSLLTSEMPPGYFWESIWVVVSPSEDDTLAVAQSLAARYRGVTLVPEAERRGKAAALREILRRVTGRYLVLLNGDARAEPGAAAAMIRAAEGAEGPVALMARPVPFALSDSLLDGAIALLWDLHHDFHVQLLQSGRGSHISDEMMLVSGIDPDALPEGTITDGGFIGEWVRHHRGLVAYPVQARVGISTPHTFRDHLRQRIRIERGHRQFGQLAGHRADTLGREALRSPGEMLRMVRRRVERTSHGWRSLVVLLSSEVCANLIAGIAEVVARPVPFRWPRVGGRASWSESRPGQGEEQPAF